MSLDIWVSEGPVPAPAPNAPDGISCSQCAHCEAKGLACAEIIIRRSGTRNINQWLVQITPGRTLEAIKGVHNSMRYALLLASLEQPEADSSELIEHNSSDPNEGAPVDMD